MRRAFTLQLYATPEVTPINPGDVELRQRDDGRWQWFDLVNGQAIRGVYKSKREAEFKWGVAKSLAMQWHQREARERAMLKAHDLYKPAAKAQFVVDELTQYAKEDAQATQAILGYMPPKPVANSGGASTAQFQAFADDHVVDDKWCLWCITCKAWVKKANGLRYTFDSAKAARVAAVMLHDKSHLMRPKRRSPKAGIVPVAVTVDEQKA